MIYYETGHWSLSFVCRWHGSVFPRALSWAIPSGIASVIIQIYYGDHGDNYFGHRENIDKTVSQAFFAFTGVVGFLIVFRTQQGYSRYWEGASLLQNVKAYWLNAASNLCAFCTHDPEKQEDVDRFQHLLVRLISFLHCSALQTVSIMHDTDFEVIDLSGLSSDYVEHVCSHEHNKCFIVMQSVQQLVVEHIRLGVLDIAPPITSRVFQELSNGIVALTNVRKITDIPFPFPYAQLVSVMLCVSTISTPVVTGILIYTPHWAGILTFMLQFAFWSMNYIAAEIEMPFGDDLNDLPIVELQKEMNDCLINLLHPLIERSPAFSYRAELHKKLDKMRCSAAMESADKFEKTRGRRGCVYARRHSMRGGIAYARRLSSLAIDASEAIVGSPFLGSPKPSRGTESTPESAERSAFAADSNFSERSAFAADSQNSRTSDSPYAKDDEAKDEDTKHSQAAKDVPFSAVFDSGAAKISGTREDTFSDSSHKEMCRLEVSSERYEHSSLPAKEEKFIGGVSFSNQTFEPLGICHELSMQSRRMETLLGRIFAEVEQIRADGNRLSNGLLGVKGSSSSRAFSQLI